MNEGTVFLGAVFLLVAIYLILFEDSPEAKLFGGGILGILGLLTLIKGIKAK